MRFGSVCSGIEAASVAWHPLGWQAAWFSEIEPFPCAVLAHHYPEVPNHGDMTELPNLIMAGKVEAPDLFCGGTPCQAFSVAGLRKSLRDARGNLSLTFCEIADAIDDVRRARGDAECIVFWENVPGVLSTKDNAFGCFLAGLAGEDVPLEPAGGKWTDAGVVLGPARAVAWRVLDAQYFALAQRRKRVFVVASARADFDPAAVLLEWEGVRRDSAPSREARESAARGAAAGAGVSQPYTVGNTLTAHAFDARQSDVIQYGDKTGPLDTDGHTVGVLAYDDRNQAAHPFTHHTLRSEALGSRVSDAVMTPVGVTLHGTDGKQVDSSDTGLGPNIVFPAMQVRRLTPRECERLQGFPDDYTMIPWRKKPASECPDGPRYKALGNSWAVPVVRWIGARIHRSIPLICDTKFC